MNCLKCGNPIKDGQKFCVICGTPCGIPMKKLCTKCGSELMDGARFCLSCGEPVQAAAAVQNTQPDTVTMPVQPAAPAAPVQAEQVAYSVPEQPAQYKSETPKVANSRRNIIILVVVLVLLLVGAFVTMFAVSASEKAELVDTLALAERYLEEQNYDQAVIEFEKMLDIDPKNADAYIGLAEAYEAMGDYDKARDMLREALDMVADEDAERIADALEELEERIEEIEAEQAAAKEISDMLTLGEKYLDEKDYEQAIIIFNKLLELDPANADAYLGLSEAYIAVGEYEMAREVLINATDFVSEEDRERIEKALAELEQLIEDSKPVMESVNEIIGEYYEDVVAKYGDVLIFETEQEYNEAPEGLIVQASASAADGVYEGDTVYVTVSMGPESFGGFTPSGDAGTITFLGYYDITVDAKGKDQYKMFTAEEFGGGIEWVSSSSGSAYYEKLATMIAADDSPDIITYEQLAFPYGVSKNMFESLDEHIDMDSELWVDMKPYIEAYEYNDNHYYYPHMVNTMYALNYNRRTIEAAGLPDPYELYRNGEWTWSAWQSMMADFCGMSDDHIGYYAVSTMLPSFVNTTGQAVITSDGSAFSNNCNSTLTNTAMDFLSELDRMGLFYPDSHPYGDWLSPQMWAVDSDKILFLMMEPEWTYIAATEEIQNQSGVDNDICGVVSDFAFVPLPRYDDADAYYNTISTFGYMVPKGAKNMSGAVEWINLNRMYDKDENIRAQQREASISPTPVYYTAGKYEGKEKWQITWDADMYDLLIEMRTPGKFAPVNDLTFGFGDELSMVVTDSMYNSSVGVKTWEEYCAEIMPVVDSIIYEY